MGFVRSHLDTGSSSGLPSTRKSNQNKKMPRINKGTESRGLSLGEVKRDLSKVKRDLSKVKRDLSAVYTT